MQELDDEERRHLTLDDGYEEDLVAVDTKEVVVRRGDHRRHVLSLRGPLLRLKEVVTDGAADDALPVLLQEDVPRGVDQEQTVDHGCSGAGGTGAKPPRALPTQAPPLAPPALPRWPRPSRAQPGCRKRRPRRADKRAQRSGRVSATSAAIGRPARACAPHGDEARGS